MSNTCIYLDYNFLLLWYFLIRKVNGKKRAVKEIYIGNQFVSFKALYKNYFQVDFSTKILF